MNKEDFNSMMDDYVRDNFEQKTMMISGVVIKVLVCSKFDER